MPHPLTHWPLSRSMAGGHNKGRSLGSVERGVGRDEWEEGSGKRGVGSGKNGVGGGEWEEESGKRCYAQNVK